MKWDQLPDNGTLQRTAAALRANGIEAFIVKDGAAAKEKALELLPAGTEVMTMTSVTLDTIGLSKEINESGRFAPVRARLSTMDRKTQGPEMQKLGAAPACVAGSVHAVTEDGKVLIASNTGSQLPAYAYGSDRVVWVAGAQKIVKNLDEGMRRIHQHSLVLESERARKAYGVPGSSVNKILIVNKEATPGRISLILVNERLGF